MNEGQEMISSSGALDQNNKVKRVELKNTTCKGEKKKSKISGVKRRMLGSLEDNRQKKMCVNDNVTTLTEAMDANLHLAP